MSVLAWVFLIVLVLPILVFSIGIVIALNDLCKQEQPHNTEEDI